MAGGDEAGVLRTSFASSSPLEAEAMLSQAYADNRLRVHGSPHGMRFGHARTDLGGVRLDTLHNSIDVSYDVEPMDFLLMARCVEGRILVRTGSGPERLMLPGDVFLAATPDVPMVTRQAGVRLQAVNIDRAVLAGIGGEALPDVLARLTSDALPPDRAVFWQRTLAYVGDLTAGSPEHVPPLLLDALRRLVVVAALSAFDPANAHASTARDRRDALPVVVRLATAFMDANPDLPIGVADVARAAHVSVRSLQLAFRHHLGTTPTAYLRRVRMDRVHAELLAGSAPDGVTVAAVAARWGFVAAGRFSADYRATYGELPRETLRR